MPLWRISGKLRGTGERVESIMHAADRAAALAEARQTGVLVQRLGRLEDGRVVEEEVIDPSEADPDGALAASMPAKPAAFYTPGRVMDHPFRMLRVVGVALDWINYILIIILPIVGFVLVITFLLRGTVSGAAMAVLWTIIAIITAAIWMALGQAMQAIHELVIRQRKQASVPS